ncbi:MAG: hypothetical protein JSV07_08295 [Acidimicrobiia bacterium]|nr:MAG: hypothetical protein JSV07_08295 [Acidimicrobiia bacterium]
MTVRLSVIGLVFAVLLGMLSTRLWFVQVAQGAEYEVQAEGQRVKPAPTVAARGEIVDRNGRLMAGIERVPTLVIDPTQIGDEEAVDRLIQEISALVELPAWEVKDFFESRPENQLFRLDRLDGAVLSPDAALFVLSRKGRFPGVEVEWTPIRTYPLADVAAHVLGYAAAPSAEDLEDRPELDRNGIVGKAGVERSYDELLQGTRGNKLFTITPSGQITGLVEEQSAIPGHRVVLNIDTELSVVVQQALADGIELSRRTAVSEVYDDGELVEVIQSTASSGAVVVLDATSGAVLSMVSLPSFEPQSFVEGISTEQFEELIENKAFNNLAIQGQFSPGSSFKAITYFTAMNQGIFAYSPELEGPLASDVAPLDIPADGRIVFPFRQDGDEASQLLFPDTRCGGWEVDLHLAFEESCNGYFWATAYSLWATYKGTDNEAVLQDHARQVGLGSPTGVDLPFEATGLVPDRELYLEWAEESPNRLAPFRFQPGSIWVGGDLLNLAIGQGDVLATPLQMAVAFSSLSTGRVYEPHVVRRVEDADGRAVQVIRPRLIRTLDVPESFLTSFRNDLASVTAGGTAETAFEVMDKVAQVGGKTGTADHAAGKLPHSWFVGVAPVQAPRYVVAVVVEEGGGGGSIAAHTARAILQHLLDEEVDPIIEDGQLGSPMPWDVPAEDEEAADLPEDEDAVLPEEEESP